VLGSEPTESYLDELEMVAEKEIKRRGKFGRILFPTPFSLC